MKEMEIIHKGLKEVCFGNHAEYASLASALTEKVNDLDDKNLGQEILEGRVRLLMDALGETLAGRYSELSLLAVANIVVALDYFLRPDDDVPDTEVGGYTDDLQQVESVFARFKEEMDAFQEWKAANDI